jgi:hypothetical protein
LQEFIVTTPITINNLKCKEKGTTTFDLLGVVE